MERVDIQKKKIVRDKCHNEEIKRRQNTQRAVKPLGRILFRIWIVLVQTQDKDVLPGTIQSPMTYNTHRQLQILCNETLISTDPVNSPQTDLGSYNQNL